MLTTRMIFLAMNYTLNNVKRTIENTIRKTTMTVATPEQVMNFVSELETVRKHQRDSLI